MEVDLLSLLRSHPALTVFLLIAFGYVVGDIRLAGVQLGPSTGVLLGGLTMTGTPALGVVTRVAQSPLPMLGHAGTYAVANVVLAVAGGLMVRL